MSWKINCINIINDINEGPNYNYQIWSKGWLPTLCPLLFLFIRKNSEKKKREFSIFEIS